jgi:hypothetical protein
MPMIIFREKLAMAAYRIGQRMRGMDEQNQKVFMMQIFAEAELVFGVWDDPQQLGGVGYRLIKGRDLLSRERDAVAVQVNEPWRIGTVPCLNEKHAVAIQEFFGAKLH